MKINKTLFYYSAAVVLGIALSYRLIDITRYLLLVCSLLVVMRGSHLVYIAGIAALVSILLTKATSINEHISLDIDFVPLALPPVVYALIVNVYPKFKLYVTDTINIYILIAIVFLTTSISSSSIGPNLISNLLADAAFFSICYYLIGYMSKRFN